MHSVNAPGEGPVPNEALSAGPAPDGTDPADPLSAPSVHPAPSAQSALSARDRDLLAFERQWWKYAGAKEQAIRELFNMSATRYYQLLNQLIDRPEALAYDPMLVKRLRRMRAQRQRQRAARRLGIRT